MCVAFYTNITLLVKLTSGERVVKMAYITEHEGKKSAEEAHSRLIWAKTVVESRSFLRTL